MAQSDYHVPEGYTLDTAADYDTYESAAWKSMAAYIRDGVLIEETDAHSRARAFNLLWLAGHPSLRLSLDSDVMPFIKKEPELLYLFTFAAALKQHQSEGTCDKIALHKAGLEAVFGAAEANKQIKKIDDVKRLMKLKKKGKLDAWLEQTLD